MPVSAVSPGLITAALSTIDAALRLNPHGPSLDRETLQSLYNDAARNQKQALAEDLKLLAVSHPILNDPQQRFLCLKRVRDSLGGLNTNNRPPSAETPPPQSPPWPASGRSYPLAWRELPLGARLTLVNNGEPELLRLFETCPRNHAEYLADHYLVWLTTFLKEPNRPDAASLNTTLTAVLAMVEDRSTLELRDTFWMTVLHAAEFEACNARLETDKAPEAAASAKASRIADDRLRLAASWVNGILAFLRRALPEGDALPTRTRESRPFSPWHAHFSAETRAVLGKEARKHYPRVEALTEDQSRHGQFLARILNEQLRTMRVSSPERLTGAVLQNLRPELRIAEEILAYVCHEAAIKRPGHAFIKAFWRDMTALYRPGLGPALATLSRLLARPPRAAR